MATSTLRWRDRGDGYGRLYHLAVGSGGTYRVMASCFGRAGRMWSATYQPAMEELGGFSEAQRLHGDTMGEVALAKSRGRLACIRACERHHAETTV